MYLHDWQFDNLRDTDGYFLLLAYNKCNKLAHIKAHSSKNVNVSLYFLVMPLKDI